MLKEFCKHGPHYLLVHITTREPGSTKLVKKQVMWDMVKCSGKIKINGINLMLRANCGGYKIKTSYQTGNYRFRFGEIRPAMI
jgi:hypothetical protein